MAEKILATVGGLQVTESEVNEFIASLGQRGQMYNNPEGRRAILQQLIGNKLLLLDAKRNLYEAEPAFREQLNRLKDNLLTSYAGEKAISGVNVTETEAKEYYEGHKEEFVTGETVNASHILVDSEEKAKAIYEEIASGKKTFEDAAAEYSSCPSKQNGGNLGDFGRGQMVPEFDSAVFEMEVGAITETPVKTQFGYHLIKLVSKSESKETPYDEIKEEIKTALLNDKRRKAYESKINQLKIMYPVDMMTI
ncbi:MAG: peptidylprolyl isomerase [Ruminococcaceae bacterium]|nr:peptidylprolyl isomerase [Oscillospiraceae bacterium]